MLSGRASVRFITMLLLAALLSGCHFDPNARKQRYLASGERYSAKGKYREAAIQFLNAVKIDKNYAAAHYDLAQAYVHLGQFGAAYAELSRTVDLQPSNYKARIDLANLELAGGKVKDAQTQANAVMAAQPNNPDLHALLSAIAVKQGKKDEALIQIRRALEIDPNRAAFHEDLALLEAGDAGSIASAEAELKKAVALDPKSVNAQLVLVAYYARTKRWSEAEQESRNAIATDPKNLAARQSLAQVFLMQGDQAKAEEVLRQAADDLADNPQGVQLLAEYYEHTGQNAKAEAEYARLFGKYPKNLPLQEAYVRALVRNKDDSTAQTVVADLMKKHGQDPQVLALYGIVLVNDGKAADAVNVLQNAARDFPNDALIQYWLGKAALAKGDSVLAQTSFQHAVQLDPSALEALAQLAGIARQRSDMNLLSDTASKMITSAPRDPDGYIWRAIAELNRNTPDSAEADLKTAISMAPRDAQAYVELGTLQFEQKRFPEGVASMEQALGYNPNSVDALRMLLNYDLYMKEPGKALDRVNAQIAKSPTNSDFLDLLCQLQIQTSKLDQAALTAQKAIQMNPRDGEAVMLFTRIEVQRGQTANAISVWEQWLNTHPNDAGAFAVLGMLEESSGKLADAEAHYRKSLAIQPQQPLAANNLAYQMLESGANVDVALTLAQTARQGMPDSPTTADTLAWAYYYKGAYDFARDLLETAVKAEPNDAAMQYHLGMVYEKLKDTSDARVHLTRAISLDPHSPAASDARVGLNGLGS